MAGLQVTPEGQDSNLTRSAIYRQGRELINAGQRREDVAAIRNVD